MKRLAFEPLTPALWPALERLFGARGACGGCWCMWWRLSRAEWKKGKGASNRRAFRKIVEHGPPPGLLAFAGDEPIAWCALAPREEYELLVRSRSLKPVDDQPVWSITCFFVDKAWRRRGVSSALLEAAAKLARAQGARLLEGYPVDPRTNSMPDAFAWTGTLKAFERSGFREVARRSKTRPIVRRALAGRKTAPATSASSRAGPARSS
ncbi:MAG: GNAT family N-acetyltransferase [Planctomycetes bacterium]|nr:GNAT family N-acetyltransferase [Planctomycetota bacterium]